MYVKQTLARRALIANRAEPSGRGIAGFTIIELLVVIVVIGILAAISIVAYNGITNRANDTANESNTANILKIAEVHRSYEGIYPEIISIWLGQDEFGNEHTIYRLDTNVTDVDSSIYRNPAAPDWSGSTLILNVNPGVGGTSAPFDNWDRAVAVEIPRWIPGGYSSWSEFYDALNQATSDWMVSNPLPPEGAPQAELDQYLQNFLAAHPQFSCVFSESCNEGDGPVFEQREVKKEWMYFITPLVRNEDAGTMLCINARQDYAKITGFSIKYYSQSKSSWVEKKTGSGVVGSFQTCPM